MGQVAFSRDFKMLEDTKWHSGIKVLRDGLAVLGPLTPVPWLMILGSDMAMGSSGNLKKMVCLRLVSLSSCTGIRRVWAFQLSGECDLQPMSCRNEKLTVQTEQLLWAVQQMDERIKVRLPSINTPMIF